MNPKSIRGRAGRRSNGTQAISICVVFCMNLALVGCGSADERVRPAPLEGGSDAKSDVSSGVVDSGSDAGQSDAGAQSDADVDAAEASGQPSDSSIEDGAVESGTDGASEAAALTDGADG
jgi:hypothetical protein